MFKLSELSDQVKPANRSVRKRRNGQRRPHMHGRGVRRMRSSGQGALSVRRSRALVLCS